MEFKQELRELHSVASCNKSNGFRDEQTDNTYGQVPPLFHRCLLQCYFIIFLLSVMIVEIQHKASTDRIENLQNKRVYEAYKMESRKMWKREN